MPLLPSCSPRQSFSNFRRPTFFPNTTNAVVSELQTVAPTDLEGTVIEEKAYRLPLDEHGCC